MSSLDISTPYKTNSKSDEEQHIINQEQMNQWKIENFNSIYLSSVEKSSIQHSLNEEVKSDS